MSDDIRASEVLQGGVVGPQAPPEQEPPTENLARRELAGTRTLWGDAWYRLRRNKMALAALTWIVILVAVTLTADLWVPQHFGMPNAINTATAEANQFLGPSLGHPFGTNQLGQDMFSQVVYGARVSLSVGFLAVAIAVVVGLLLGAISGFYGGLADTLIMRVADVFLAFPYIIFALLVLSVLPRDFVTGSILPTVLTIGVLGWPSIARVLRSSILSVKQNDYVDAGRALGANDGRLIMRHILPNAIAPILVYATMSVGGAILTEAALSVLGLGILPNNLSTMISWGQMIAQGQPYLTSSPGVVLWPGLAIVTTVLAFTLLGDGVRDALDVKMKD